MPSIGYDIIDKRTLKDQRVQLLFTKELLEKVDCISRTLGTSRNNFIFSLLEKSINEFDRNGGNLDYNTFHIYGEDIDLSWVGNKVFIPNEANIYEILTIIEKNNKQYSIDAIKLLVKYVSLRYPNYQPTNIYFITDGEFIKVGKADSIKKRLSQLQVGNGRKLEVIAALINVSPDLEDLLHFLYNNTRRSGEWFDLLDLLDIEALSKLFPYKGDC